MNTDFAFKILSAFDNADLFFSPFSIKTALGMCALGASRDTRKEMVDILDLPDSEIEQASQARDFIFNLNEGKKPYTLNIVNDLWVDKNFNLRSLYKKTIADNYDGNINGCDFINYPEKAVSIINEHISKKTNNKIKDLISPDFINDETKLVLTNAVYFKGSWFKKFDEYHTKKESFCNNNICTQVQMMNAVGTYNYYGGDPDFQVVDLLYEGKELSMSIFLPRNKKLTLNEAESKLNTCRFEECTNSCYETGKVNLSIPKFKVETPTYELTGKLQEMGMKLAFSDMATFNRISEDALKISRVLHKAFVEVNEEGTEAAAATGVSMMRCTSALPNKNPIVFKADHPFLYFIRHQPTNNILFAGRFSG